MSREQIIKTLKVLFIATIILVALEVIFIIPGVTEFFTRLINGNGVSTYIIIGVLMFLQGTVLNIPAVTIIELSALAGIETFSFMYILVVMIAYMLAALTSYFIGYKFGSKAVKWIAGDEEEFNKWCVVINNKGKWWYAASIILPIFPDDLLCIVAGSVKMNLPFYIVANFIGRTIGLITMILTLKLVGKIGGNFPIMLIVWVLALIAEIIVYLVIRREKKNNDKRN